MCISATVLAAASIGIAAAGTVATIDNANYQAKMAEFQLEEQRDAIRSQREAMRLQGMEGEIARIREFEEMRARNLAALASSGVGQNNSYLQGIEKAEERALRFDLTNIRLGMAGEDNRLMNQARSTRYASTINRANRNSAVVGSLFNFASQAVGAASLYGTYKTPSAPSGTGGGYTQMPLGNQGIHAGGAYG